MKKHPSNQNLRSTIARRYMNNDISRIRSKTAEYKQLSCQNSKFSCRRLLCGTRKSVSFSLLLASCTLSCFIVVLDVTAEIIVLRVYKFSILSHQIDLYFIYIIIFLNAISHRVVIFLLVCRQVFSLYISIHIKTATKDVIDYKKK